MAVLSIIKLSDLTRFKRMDAEYYQPENLRLYDLLMRIGSIRLGDKDYAKVTDGIHTSIDFDLNSGIRCLFAQSVKKGYFDLSADTFISKEQHSRNLKTSLRSGDVILSSVGTIGNCAVVNETMLPANADRDVGIIRTTERLDPYYLCAFLNSKYGVFQSIRESTGNVQLHLFIDKMNEILVPILSQQEDIASKMKQATSLMLSSEKLFLSAQATLLTRLGFTGINLEQKTTYVGSYELIKQSHRIDAEYYQPKYDYVLNKVKESKEGFCRLVDRAPLSENKINPQRTPDERFTYIELADINGSFGTIDEYTVTSGNSAPSRARMLLKKNDVIASAVKGSLSKVALVPQQFDKAIGSTGFFVFRPKAEMLCGYLLAIVKSPIVQSQLERESTGTVLTSVPRESARKIIIPDLLEERQKDINEMVLESHKLRNKARVLINQAIEGVESGVGKITLFAEAAPKQNIT